MRNSASALVILFALAFSAIAASAQEAATKVEPTKATYSVTGLHCPPCSRTVESSLERVPGIKAVKVDWGSKTARLTFDESKVSAQKISQLIATTPHMMGGGMRYDGWLALSVPSLADDAAAKTVQETLKKVPGVTQVATFPKSHTVSVHFSNQGSVTSKQLIDTLTAAGLKATTY